MGVEDTGSRGLKRDDQHRLQMGRILSEETVVGELNRVGFGPNLHLFSRFLSCFLFCLVLCFCFKLDLRCNGEDLREMRATEGVL
jgi:hypothetical protein